MDNSKHLGWLLLLAACGSGGGGSGNTTNPTTAESLTGNLVLLDHAPADGAVQVGTDSTIELSFDASVVPECLQDPDTWLRDAHGNDVAGSFSLASGGRTVIFAPSQPLGEASDYVFQLAPLTCDVGGRILEVTERFEFRTFDAVPPTLTSTSIASGSQGVGQQLPVVLSFSEALDPASVDTTSVVLRDAFGTAHPLDVTLDGSDIIATPAADLAGSRTYVLTARAGLVTDRAGNELAAAATVRFTTQQDTTPPFVLGHWPAQGQTAMSPLVAPTITFNESIDPFSVEPSSVAFLDEFGNLIPYGAEASRDRRSLRLRPEIALSAGRLYRIALSTGLAAVTDATGNPLTGSPVTLQWTCGSDDVAPTVIHTTPTDGAAQVGLTSQVVVDLDEGLDPSSVDSNTVSLEDWLGAVPTTVALSQLDRRITVIPTYDLDPGASYTLRLRGGDEGLRDKAGNPLATDAALAFTATLDETPPEVLIQPENGMTAIPPEAVISAVFDSQIDPDTVTLDTVRVRDGQGQPIAGTVRLDFGRVVVFTPAAPWTPFENVTLTLRGGMDGIREVSGNTLRSDATATFRSGSNPDSTPPEVRITLNATDVRRLPDLAVPTWGFAIDATVLDDIPRREDLGTVSIFIRDGTGSSTATGLGPSVTEVYRTAIIAPGTLRWTFPSSLALAPGTYTVQVEASDLSGNAGLSDPLTFEVLEPSTNLLPFERTQVVWIRTDLDRDGTGIADFDEDLVRLGLSAAGDPAGTNAFMREVVLNGILSQANQLLGRDPATGAPNGLDSVPMRLTTREPLGAPHMQMALGGFDPEGEAGRGYGDESTGVLGRALYDYRNATVNERNIAANPGLGVFCAELFLYQSRIHLQVYPGYVTTFARGFLNLAPSMGGTPAGADPLDATVLTPTFDYASASNTERGRFDQVMEAADEWATAMGIILTHEIGHSVGLVAPGTNAESGLHGDSSLHNEFSSLGEVMASAVGYDAMVSLDYAFRDLNAAYLRQRMLIR